MHREIFINVTPHERRVAVLENKRIEEFYIERPDQVNLVGNIYKGRVESVLPGMGAAFVDIGLAKNGFLYVDDVVAPSSGIDNLLESAPYEVVTDKRERRRSMPSISELLKKGDEILVQVVKEPIGTKGARLTAHVSIPGRFLVMMPFDNNIGISKRIEARAERDRIRKILADLKLPKDIGFIVRTAAEKASQKDFFREARYLMSLWNHIKARSRRAKPPQILHQEYDIILRVTRDLFTDDVSRFETDSKNDYRRISRFLRILAPQLRSRLRLFNDRVPMFEKFDIERQIDKIYHRMAQLKSGGYLIFDETESLVAIDVNSGKFVGKRNLEDTAFKTNMEAAEEIPRQLKLRDIGGIIIIDFIDMERSEHRKSVIKTLERRLEDDKAKTNILNISSLGLVEMTRQRVRKSVEGKSYQKCLYCNGRGMVKSASMVAMELVRKLEHALRESRTRDVSIGLHPEVARYVLDPAHNIIRPLERQYRKAIRVVEDPVLHMEEIKITQVP